MSATASSKLSVSISLASTSTFFLFRLATGLPREDVALQFDGPAFLVFPRNTPSNAGRDLFRGCAVFTNGFMFHAKINKRSRDFRSSWVLLGLE
jgi:hypothetical protein